VPVKHVHFSIEKSVDCSLDGVYGKEVVGRVYEQTSPFVVRLIIYQNRNSSDKILPLFVYFKQLAESLKTS
jgi:hypothetical protein